jgi:hypothetical protein
VVPVLDFTDFVIKQHNTSGMISWMFGISQGLGIH